jgi:hypothetical protein
MAVAFFVLFFCGTNGAPGAPYTFFTLKKKLFHLFTAKKEILPKVRQSTPWRYCVYYENEINTTILETSILAISPARLDI